MTITTSCKRFASLALAPALMVGFGLTAARPAAAQTVTIYNFQATGKNTTYAGQGALGAGGTTFNRVKNTTAVNGTAGTGFVYNGGIYSVTPTGSVVNSNNTASSVAFMVTADNGYFPATDPTTTNSPSRLLQNYFAAQPGATNYPTTSGGSGSKETNGIGDISLTGLAANTPFALYLYGVNGVNAPDGQQTLFTLTDSSFASLTGASAQSGTVTETQETSFVQGVNYVIFQGTTSSTGGVFATYTAAASNTAAAPEGDLSAVQIELNPPVAAPEPSQVLTLTIAALALGGLMLKARKRQMA